MGDQRFGSCTWMQVYWYVGALLKRKKERSLFWGKTCSIWWLLWWWSLRSWIPLGLCLQVRSCHFLQNFGSCGSWSAVQPLVIMDPHQSHWALGYFTCWPFPVQAFGFVRILLSLTEPCVTCGSLSVLLSYGSFWNLVNPAEPWVACGSATVLYIVENENACGAAHVSKAYGGIFEKEKTV